MSNSKRAHDAGEPGRLSGRFMTYPHFLWWSRKVLWVPAILGAVLTILALAPVKLAFFKNLATANGARPYPTLASVARPLKLVPEAELLIEKRTAEIINIFTGDLSVTLPETGEFLFVFEQSLLYENAGDEYRALRVRASADRLQFEIVAGSKGREQSFGTLEVPELKRSSGKIRLKAGRDHRLWILRCNGRQIGTCPKDLSSSTMKLASSGDGAWIHAFRLLFESYRSGGRIDLNFGLRFLLARDTLALGVVGTGLVWLCSTMFCWLGVGWTSFRPITVFYVEWGSWLPIVMSSMVATLLPEQSKIILYGGVLFTGCLKLWLALILGGRPRTVTHGFSRKVRRIIGVAVGGLLILNLFSYPSQRSAGNSKVIRQESEQILNVAEPTVYLLDDMTFRTGEIALEFELAEASVVELFFRGFYSGTTLRERWGYLLSSDPSFPCRFVHEVDDRIDQWGSQLGVLFPAGQPINLLVKISELRCSVYHQGSKIASSWIWGSHDEILGLFSIKGDMKLNRYAVTTLKTKRSLLPNSRSLLNTARIAGLIVLTLMALRVMLGLRYRSTGELVGVAIMPALIWSIISGLLQRWTAIEPTRWVGTMLALSYFVFLYLILIRVSLAFRKSPRAKLLFFIGLLAGFCIIEYFLGCWAPDPTRYYFHQAEMYARSPTTRGYEWFSIPKLRAGNRYLRNRLFSIRSDPATVSDSTALLFLGGSTTEGTPNQLLAETDYPNMTTKLVTTMTSKQHGLINGGVGGYTTLQVWLWYHDRLRTIDHDWVILNSLYNNIATLTRSTQLEHLERLYRDSGGLVSALLYYGRNSRLGLLLASARPILISQSTYKPCLTSDEYYQVLLNFLKRSSPTEPRLIMIHEASKLGYDEYDRCSLIYFYHQMLTNFCRKYDLLEVNPIPLLRQYPPEQIFVDEVHLSDLGNQLLSQAVAETIVQVEGRDATD